MKYILIILMLSVVVFSEDERTDWLGLPFNQCAYIKYRIRADSTVLTLKKKCQGSTVGSVMHTKLKFRATGGKIYLSSIDTVIMVPGRVVPDSVIWGNGD